MIRKSVFCLIACPLLAVAQPQVEFPCQACNFYRLAPLTKGTLLLGSYPAGSLPLPGHAPDPSTPAHIGIELLEVGNTLFEPDSSSLGGNGIDIPQAAALDPAGDVWIVGNTNSDDFNLVNPIVAGKVAYRTAGFVIKLSARGTVLFSSYLCGQQPQPRFEFSYYSTATSIAFDTAGNAYVGGSTDEPDFPTTQGAYLGGKGAFGVAYSYLMKISPTGKLIYSTELTPRHTGDLALRLAKGTRPRS